MATNEAGRRASGNRTFTTSREPTAITLSLAAPRTNWGDGIEVFGRVSGRGVNGIQVALERQDFPFAGPFSAFGAPAPMRANRDGTFRFYVPTLFSATRLHALTRTSVQAVSAPVTANVAVRVGARLRRGTRRAVRIRGSVVPAVPNGRAVLQRLTRRGSWAFVRGTAPRAAGVQPLPLRLQGPQAAHPADLPRARDRARRRRARARHEPQRHGRAALKTR